MRGCEMAETSKFVAQEESWKECVPLEEKLAT
jgi:hypothetical protein